MTATEKLRKRLDFLRDEIRELESRYLITAFQEGMVHQMESEIKSIKQILRQEEE